MPLTRAMSAPWRQIPKRNVACVCLGADCAGLNLGCIALETLGIDAQLVFPSEKNKATHSMLNHNFDIETTQVAHDVIERDDSTLPHVELYTARPPCQCFEGREQTRVSLTLVAWCYCACCSSSAAKTRQHLSSRTPWASKHATNVHLISS